METVGTIRNACAAYVQRTTPSDFVINSGGNQIDIFYLAINNARRWVEKAHDFFLSQANCFLSIPSTGASLSSAYVDTSATAAGTLSPNVAGSFALTGLYNGLPFYTRTVTGTVYFLAYNTSLSAWTVTAGAFTASADRWALSTTSSSPVGSYAAAGAYTGTLTITQSTGTIGVKKISNVALPVAGGGYYPIEFLTNDEWNTRVQTQVGREAYNPEQTLAGIGVYTNSPVAYQQAYNLFLVPPQRTFTYPVVAQLSIIRWLADYTAPTDTDFLIERAPELMMWATLLEVNKYWKVQVDRQEGNLPEQTLVDERDAALQAVIAWDVSISGGTTTPAS